VAAVSTRISVYPKFALYIFAVARASVCCAHSFFAVTCREEGTNKKGCRRKGIMKKGDLSLSTTAIVVLIVAIVVLGFIVIFVARGFGSIDDLVSREAGSVPEPARPTAAQPVTLSILPTAEIGGQFTAKVGVYNPCSSTVTVLHEITCGNPGGDTAEIVVERVGLGVREIPAGQSATMSYLGNVNAQISPGLSLCTVVLSAWEQVDVPSECALESFIATGSVEFVE
jgi:hypothetical protein